MPGPAPSAFWSLGFRPFYLLGAAFAVLALPLWVAVYLGVVLPGTPVGMGWHAHEMIFGFAPAIITGFLFTAVRNWTGQPTPTGGLLAAIAALWLAGRVLPFTGPAPLATLADVLFLPVVALAVAVPIVRSRNARNYKIIAVVALLALFNLCQHLAATGVIAPAHGRLAWLTALDIIALLMTVVGGRVIPAFTGNAVPGAVIGRSTAVEWLAIAPLVLLPVAGLARTALDLPAWLFALLAAAGALGQGARLALWRPWQTRHNALLWMLPAGYAWIPVALALRAAAEAGLVPPVLALHALTAGAMGSLMIAMMMRSALGHTGRPLLAGRWEVCAFLLVSAGAAVRVFGALAWPEGYPLVVAVAGVLWAAAFAVFLWRFAPLLLAPRPA